MSLYEFGRKNTWTKQAQSLLSVASRLVLGYESEQVPLLYFLYYCATAGGTRPLLDSDGGGQDSRLLGGTMRLLTALQDFVEHAGGCIRLDTVVQSVDYCDDSSASSKGVVVRCQSGGSEMKLTARRLIFCIPPSCLSHIDFCPRPSPWKQSLWHRSKAGCYIKIIVFYKTAFWRSNGFSGSCVCENSNIAENRPLVGVFDYCEEDEGGEVATCALCCFVCGSVGEDFSGLLLCQQRMSVCAHLEVLFGAEAGDEHVQDILIMDWLHDSDGSPAFGGECSPHLSPCSHTAAHQMS